MSKDGIVFRANDQEDSSLRISTYDEPCYLFVVGVEDTDNEPGYATCGLTYEQALELHRALGIALGDERVRRAELERSKGK